jgi:Flp pilus assembly protein TadG
MKHQQQVRKCRRQVGSAAVEFALVAAFGGFMVALFAAVEVARLLFMMSSANEATELGARVAVVCDPRSSRILTRMQDVMPSLTASDVNIVYNPAGCADGSVKSAQETCDSVSVSIKPGVKVATYIPFVNLGFDLPAFTTTLPREALDSTTCA